MGETDCFWEPEDPRCCDGVLCPVEPEKEGGKGMDGQNGGDGAMPGDMMMATWTGQVAYLVLASLMTARAGLNLWRYESGTVAEAAFTAYENAAGSGSTNMWKLGWYINRRGDLSMFGLAWITQLLSTFGVLPGLNRIVWVWGVGAFGALAALTSGISYYIAYDKMYTAKNDEVKG